MTPEEIHEHMSIAAELVEDVGMIALEYFRKPIQVDDKMPGVFYDPVTQADKRIEEKLREGLIQRFPGYSILGEEYGSEGDGEYRWIIDPIDGTRAFISGTTGWGVLLGLATDTQCLGGILHQPFTRETFVSDSNGTWLHDDRGTHRLQSRQDAKLSDAIIFCTHPILFPSEGERNGFQDVSARCRLQRFGGDCYSYGLLAHGCIDIVIEGLLQPYDIVPLVPIIESAGGKITNIHGDTPMHGGTVIAAANETLHAQALEIMQQSANA